MIPYAQLAPGDGFQADRAILYYAQRLASWPTMRRAISAVIAAGVRRRHGDGQDWASNEDTARAIGELRQDGVSMLSPLLSDDALASLTDYFLHAPVLGPNGEMVPVDELPASVSAASYRLDTVLDCPGISAVMNAPHILRLASDYLGCKPTLSSVGVRWSLPTGSQGARFQEFHRDVDDWRFLKLFIYLTDVDADCGPHSYVRGSHTTAFGWNAKVYAEDEIERQFGADRLMTVTGPRGTTFVADTLGVHRGGRPIARPRLILQLQYSLLPVFAFDYSPIERASAPGDAYCNRLMFQQSGDVDWFAEGAVIRESLA